MWYTRSIEQVAGELGVRPADGLTVSEAALRLEKTGRNTLKEEKQRSIPALFFSQMKDMLIYVLLAAVIITIILGEYVDAVIILFVVVLNGIIGVIQEYKAAQAVEALKKMSSPHALVRRNGKTVEIAAEEVVPGDVVILDAGRIVPADLRLIKTVELHIDESALTGESLPVDKAPEALEGDGGIPVGDRRNMAFMSTLVTTGRGEGIAVATGMETEIGRIAESLGGEEEGLTPLQKRLEELGKMLGYLAMGVCIVIFIIALFQKRDLFEMFLTAVSLAVAAIPEGLAAIVAIVLALGVTRMAKINAIVRRLPAVETLGCVNIVCSDKTGTLTRNEMTVVRVVTSGGGRDISAEPPVIKGDTVQTALAETMALCNDATWSEEGSTGDPTEIALVILAERFGLGKAALEKEHKRVSERPFDSVRKRMSTVNRLGDGYRINTKGAVDTILDVCSHVAVGEGVEPLSEESRKEILVGAEEMSERALRVLGAAYRDTSSVPDREDMEHDLVFLGIAGMIDPPRTEVRDSVVTAKQAGITPVMITGDHKRTAFAIARELGIADSEGECISGSELDALSEESFARTVDRYKVFARVSPEHKVRIVRALKKAGHIVSMTGDGVNDAPSLKAADIGVAMGITGTDVSKGAADMVLTDDNFTTIIRAVEVGRNIYNNIKKAVIFLLSCNLGEVITIMASILFGWVIPLLPTQILWINLVTDTLPALALGVDPPDRDVMKEKPRPPSESFFAGGATVRTVLGGLLIGTITLAAFVLGLGEHGFAPGAENIPEAVVAYARTMAFVVLAVSQLFYSLSMRSREHSIFRVGLMSNRYLAGAVVVGILLQLMVISIPPLAGAFKLHSISGADWLLVFGLSLIPLMANEVIKPLTLRIVHSRKY